MTRLSTHQASPESGRFGFLGNSWTGFLSFVAGGLGSAAYNYWSISLFTSNAADWAKWNHSLDPALALLSRFIPIISRIPDLLATHGYPERAILVRHLYGVDWAICLALSLFAIPSFVSATSIATAKIAAGKVDYGTFRKEDFERHMQTVFVLLLIVIAETLYEAWFGSLSFEGDSIYFNRVHIRDMDLYRLCLFVPFSLVFGGIGIAASYIKWKFRRNA